MLGVERLRESGIVTQGFVAVHQFGANSASPIFHIAEILPREAIADVGGDMRDLRLGPCEHAESVKQILIEDVAERLLLSLPVQPHTIAADGEKLCNRLFPRSSPGTWCWTTSVQTPAPGHVLAGTHISAARHWKAAVSWKRYPKLA